MVPQIFQPKYKIDDCSTAFPRLHRLSQLWERICRGGIRRSVGRPSPLSYHCELLELINLLARPKAHFQMRARTKKKNMMTSQHQGGTRFQNLTSKSETAWRNTGLFFQNSISLPQRYVTCVFIVQRLFRVYQFFAGRIMGPPILFTTEMHLPSRYLPLVEVLRLHLPWSECRECVQRLPACDIIILAPSILARVPIRACPAQVVSCGHESGIALFCTTK